MVSTSSCGMRSRLPLIAPSPNVTTPVEYPVAVAPP